MNAPQFLLLLHVLLTPGVSAAMPAAPALNTMNLTQVASVSGVVRDSAGGVIGGATVILRRANGTETRTTSDASGRFSLSAPAGAGELTLIVRANLFAESRRTLEGAGAAAGLDVTLEPAGITETVAVTPTRSEERLGDVPASVNVIAQEDIRQSPAMVADEVLQQIPTFSLFRRASSLSAHPTTQGVSLRGIGPSGVSRTLVLLDGVPYNDAFGGWVYWTAVPMESASRIEVVDGASSSLYGSYALGGVINIVTSPPARRSFELKSQYGSRSSPKLDFRATDVWGKLGVAVDGSVFNTEGYEPVLLKERGPIDNKAKVDFKNFSVKLDYNPTSRVHAFLRSGYFNEKRDNAKVTTFVPFTEEGNDTTWKYTSGGVDLKLPDASSLQATIFTDYKTFHSNNIAVPNAVTRDVGRLSLTQTVPSKSVGGMAQWSRVFMGRNAVSAGFDYRWVDGDSIEDGYDATTGTTITTHRVAGGTQKSVGAFVQDVISPVDRLTITLSARYDQWRNYAAHNTLTTIATGVVTDPVLADKTDKVTSPHVGVRYALNNRVSVWSAIGTGFRAPTLNELYRQFRVGAILTLANEKLGPEHLLGGEAGISLIPVHNMTFRTTYYDNRVRDPISNVTAPELGANTQQRRNLGRTRIQGLQTDAEYRIGNYWRLSGGYLYNLAKVRENSTNPALVGLYLAQVPKHRGSLQVQFSHPKYVNVDFDVQSVGGQFDDDTNTASRLLPKYTLVSFSVARSIGSNVELFVGGQNLLDEEFWVGTLPTLVGPPRMINGGIRLRFQGR